MKTSATLMTLAAGLLLASGAGQAQTQKTEETSAKVTDLEIDLMRKDLRDQKKQLVAANLPLNGDEAAKFWPVYNDYTQETVKVNNQRVALIKEYAAHNDTLTEEQGASYIRRWLGVDDAATKLRIEWIPKFEQVLGEK